VKKSHNPGTDKAADFARQAKPAAETASEYDYLIAGHHAA